MVKPPECEIKDDAAYEKTLIWLVRNCNRLGNPMFKDEWPELERKWARATLHVGLYVVKDYDAHYPKLREIYIEHELDPEVIPKPKNSFMNEVIHAKSD